MLIPEYVKDFHVKNMADQSKIAAISVGNGTT